MKLVETLYKDDSINICIRCTESYGIGYKYQKIYCTTYSAIVVLKKLHDVYDDL